MPKRPYIAESDGTVREGRRVGAGDLALVEVSESDLTYVRVDHQTRLRFGATEIVIETPFQLQVDDVTHALDPGERSGLGPLLAVYPDVLTTAAVDSDGSLRLLFESGTSLVVPPDAHYEAWQIVGPGTRLVVCTPGGADLAVWTQDRASARPDGVSGRFQVATLNSLALVTKLARAVASLRITDEDLVPADVSALLGCEPTSGWSKGDTLTSHGVTRTARFGMWRLQADETEPADIDAQVAAILSRLTSDQSVWAELHARYDVDLFCGWFMVYGNEGVSIKPETMSALGTRGIRLDIDLYGGDGDKAADQFDNADEITGPPIGATAHPAA